LEKLTDIIQLFYLLYLYYDLYYVLSYDLHYVLFLKLLYFQKEFLL
jgi:hypothetical protein